MSLLISQCFFLASVGIFNSEEKENEVNMVLRK